MLISLKNRDILFLLVIVSIVLRPHPSVMGNAASVFSFDLVLAAVWIFSVIYTGRLPVSLTAFRYLLLLFSLLFIGLVILVVKLDFQALFDWVKVLYISIAGFFLGNYAKQYSGRLVDHFPLLVYVLFAIFLIQLFQIAFLNDIASAIWGDTKLRGIASSSQRVYGPFYNSNWAGVCVGMLLVFYVSILRLIKARLVTVALVTSCLLIMLFLTGSRSSWVATAAGLVTFVVCNLKFISQSIFRRSIGGRILFLAGSAAIVYAGLYNFFGAVQINMQRFDELVLMLSTSDLSQMSSAESRVLIWGNAIDILIQTPLFGVMDSTASSPHNSYLYFFLIFGMPVGFSLIVVMFLLPVIILKKRDVAVLSLVCPVAVVLLAASFTADYLATTQVMLLYFVLLSTLVFVFGTQVNPQCAAGNHRDPANSLKLRSVL